MIEKDPSSISFLTYGWVLLLAVWGGVVHNINKVRNGVTKRFSLTELIGDIFISGFTGIVTFYMCEAAGTPAMLTAALVGISGHMGARAIFMFEEWLRRKVLK
jgi:hypothetical protein